MRTITAIVFVVLSSFLLSACVSTKPVKKQQEKVEVDPDVGTGNTEAAKKRLGLAMRYLELRRLEQAKRNLDKALYHIPEMPGAYIGYGYYYQIVKEFDKAEEYYKKGLQKEPNNPNFLNVYGVFLCEANRIDEAQDVFTKAVENPSYRNVADTYENMGICAFDAKDFQSAEEHLKKALTYNPNMPNSLLELAHLAFDKEQFIRSKAYLDRYNGLRNHSARSLWLAIRVESILGHKDKSASYGVKLQQLFPASDEAIKYLETKSQW